MPTSVWSTSVPAGCGTVATGGFLAVTSVSRDGRRLIARRGSRGRRHLVIAEIPDRRPARSAARRLPRRLLAADFPDEGTDLAEDGRFAPDGSAVYLRTVAGRERYALGLGPVRRRRDARPAAAAGRPGRRRPGVLRHPGRRPAAPCWSGMSDGHQHDRDHETWPAATATRSTRPAGDAGLVGAGGRPVGDSGTLRARCAPEPLPRRPGRSGVCQPGQAPANRRIGSSGLPEPELPRERLRRPADRDLPPRRTASSCRVCSYRPHGTTVPLPTVVLLHGGPESQERPAFSILIQSLVAAGMAVFAPNVRGSTGYGLTFMRMDDLDRRESSFQDVPATVRFLVDAGLSDPGPDRRAWLVLRWVPGTGGADPVAAAVRIRLQPRRDVRPADVLRRDRDLDGRGVRHRVRRSGGRCGSAAGLSPLHHFDRVRAPTLLVHGEQDTNVPVGESIRAHRALQAAGARRPRLLLLPGEGHTIVGHDGRISSTQAIVEWHARWTS